MLSLSPKIGVCISVFKFWRQEKIPLMNPKTARKKIKNKTVLFLDEDYDDVGKHKKKKKKLAK